MRGIRSIVCLCSVLTAPAGDVLEVDEAKSTLPLKEFSARVKRLGLKR